MSMQPIDSWLSGEEARREPETFPCPVDGCSRVWATAELLRTHMVQHRTMQEEEAEMPEQTDVRACPECGGVFARRGLALHRTRKHGVRKSKAVTKGPPPPASQDGHQDPELRALGAILQQAEKLSPAGRAWLVARLS